MSHFKSDCDAIVIGSYKDKYGGGEKMSQLYTIYIKGHGEVAWYYENQLELIKAGQFNLIKQWERKRNQEIKQKSDLDWIFKNGTDVLEYTAGASVSALAKCLGIKDLWGGSCGEGFVYYENSRNVLLLAEPFLKSGNKQGWLDFCSSNKQEDL